MTLSNRNNRRTAAQAKLTRVIRAIAEKGFRETDVKKRAFESLKHAIGIKKRVSGDRKLPFASANGPGMRPSC